MRFIEVKPCQASLVVDDDVVRAEIDLMSLFFVGSRSVRDDRIMSDEVMSPSQVHKRRWRIRDYSYIIPVYFIAKPNNSGSHLPKLHAVW